MFNRTGEEEAIFDVDNILEVIDTLNHANYSFQFRYDDTPLGTFYNLIVGQTPEGENTTPFVLKYTCDESQLEEFTNNNFSFQYFRGTVARHKYTDFFEENYFSRTSINCPPELDGVGDPIPCDLSSISGSGGYGGNGSGVSSGDPGNPGGNLSGDSGFSGNSGCVTILGQVLCTCVGHSVGQNCDCANQPYYDLFVICPNQNRTSNTSGRTIEDDCPDCPVSVPTGGGVATNIDLIFDARSTLKSSLSLSSNALNWLMDSTNDQEVLSAYIFMTTNSDVPNIAELTESIIEIIVDNPNINTFDDAFEEFYINDPNFLTEFYEEDAPDIPIQDMAEYLECFDTSQGATLTIYVNQPTFGDNNMINGSLDVGHAFIGLQQGENNMSYGFYPASGAGLIEPTEGVMGNNSNTNYNVSISLVITAQQLSNIINYSINFANSEYDLIDNNCTDFAIGVGNFTTLNLPEAITYVYVGAISNPGVLGEHIANMEIPSTSTGITVETTTSDYSPGNNKACD